MNSKLKEKILSKSCTVAVIGMGYVGLPLAVEKAKVGFNVIGVDIDKTKVSNINNGDNYIDDVKDEELKEIVLKKKLWATDNFEVLKEADVIVICVPTPLTVTRDPDLSHIINATDQIAKYLKKGALVTLESTTYPGTTDNIIKPKLEKDGYQVGKDFFLAFSPERVDPGNKRFTTKNTSKVVGGVTESCREVATLFYQQTIMNVVTVSSPMVAELTKVFENTYRAINIALVNELMFLCDRIGIDVWEVIDTAATKPFGIQTFYPGPGVGGHCIPIDPFYLTWKAREYDFSTRFIELAGEINIQTTYYVVDKISKALNRFEKSLKGSRVLILGVAYKRDINDIRESPALKIINLLEQAEAEVVFYDSYIAEMQPYGGNKKYRKRIVLTAEEVSSADCVVIVTDHTNVDYEWIVENAKVVVDARNATKNVSKYRDKIIKI